MEPKNRKPRLYPDSQQETRNLLTRTPTPESGNKQNNAHLLQRVMMISSYIAEERVAPVQVGKGFTRERASTMNMKELFEKYFNPRKVLETYFIQDSDFFDDTITQVFTKFLNFSSSGDVKGNSLIALCFGPFAYYTLPLCDNFNEITFACADDKSIQEMQKWLKNEPDTMDYSHAMKMICELQATGETWTEKEPVLKRKFKKILKYDVMSSNPLSPVTHPQADCLLLAHCVEHFVQDKKCYCEALKNVCTLVKPGGTLIMVTKFYATFFMCGDFKIPVFCLDEDILKDALKGAGLVIEEEYIYPRKTESLYDIADFKYFAVFKARKEREM
ncbi:nicotinamide N-methyltransferase-like [Lissotriton helveticus]